MWFSRVFRNGQRSVTEPGPTPSPWSILMDFLWPFTSDESHYVIFLNQNGFYFTEEKNF